MFDFSSKLGAPAFSDGQGPSTTRRWGYDLLTTPVEQLQKIVGDIDRSCLNGTGPREQDLKNLDDVCQTLASDQISVPTAAALNSFGHRLLRAVTTDDASLHIDMLREGLLRRSACKLITLGQANMQASYYPEEEKASHVAQQTLAGRALRLGGMDSLSLECLLAASQPWEDLLLSSNRDDIRRDQSAIRLAEVAYQAYCERAALHCRSCDAAKTLDALASAKDILDVCPDLRESLWETFLSSCEAVCQQVGKYQATDFYMLGLSSLERVAASADRAVCRSRFLRLLAVNFLLLGNSALALSHSKEAVAAAPADSEAEGKGLKVLLQILRWSFREDGKTEVEDVAARLMAHPSIHRPTKLACASLLLETGMDEAKVQECLDLIKFSVDEDIRNKEEVIRFRLRLGATVVSKALSSDSPITQTFERFFEPVLAEVEGLEANGANASIAKALQEAASAELWALSGRAAGRPSEASLWLRRAAALLSSAPDKARCLTAAAAYLREEKPQEAVALVKDALSLDPHCLQALLLTLHLSSLEATKHEMSSVASPTDALRRLLKSRSCSAEHAAAAVQLLQKLQSPDLLFEALEGLASKLEDQSAINPDSSKSLRPLGESILAVLASLLKRCDGETRSPDDFVRILKIFERTAKLWGPYVVDALETGTSPPSIAALATIITTCWDRAQVLATDTTGVLVELLEAFTKALQGLESAEDAALLTARAWFWTLLASAKTQLAKASNLNNGTPASTALLALDRAHHCSQRAARVGGQAGKRQAVHSPFGEALGNHFDPARLDSLFRVLVLLEFEARCLAGHPEVQLKQFVDEAAGQEKVGGKSLVAMAKLATDLHSRRLGVHCLQRYLRFFIGSRASSGDVDVGECAVAYRELISLQTSRQESLSIFEGIVQLLSGECSDLARSYPEAECAWLVAAAWNNGCHFYRLQQYKLSEKWLSQGLLLAKFCPNRFDEEAMTNTYMECLRQATD